MSFLCLSQGDPVKEKEISGPKLIGVHGDSYIYAVFKGLV